MHVTADGPDGYGVDKGKSCFNFRAIDDTLLDELEALTRRAYEQTAGDPAWGVAKREEHDMAYRKAMSARRQAAGGRSAER